MDVQSHRSWRVPAARAGLGWRVFTPLLTAVAVVALSANTAGAAPRTATAAAVSPNYLWSVSCPDASHCFAVGQHTKPLGQPVAAIDQLSGGTWAPVHSPGPPGSASATLVGVACASASNCLAVGTYDTSSGKSFPFAQRWNGTAWSLVTVPAAGSTSSSLDSIACASARSCWAVGSDRHGTLTEHWNGSAWAIFASPGGAGARLNSVACVAPGVCWAVGETQAGTLTLQWNVQAWTKQATPSSGTSGGILTGVSCASPTLCMAVGSGPGGMLTQQWDGKSWSLSGQVPMSAPQGASCLGGLVCMAVGVRHTNPPQQSELTMAARWNGSAWSRLSTPKPASNLNVHGLEGIACVTASDCWAVGGSGSTGEPGLASRIIEHWNGTRWSLVG